MNLNRMTIMFLCGFGGSFAVEVVMLYQHFQTEPFMVPERYKRLWFWVVRIFLAFIGGGLALAYEIDKPLLAANIGAATPLIVKAFAEGFRQPHATIPAPKAAAGGRGPKPKNGGKTAAKNVTVNGYRTGNGHAEIEAPVLPVPVIEAPATDN